jgi:hypothetical protein
MTRTGAIFSFFFTALSLAVLISAGLLWRRSLHHADIVASAKPAGKDQCVLQGFGSVDGAVLFGSVDDPQPVVGDGEYCHSVFPLTPPEGKHESLVQVVPIVKHSALGFGASKGELRLKLPFFSFLTPPPRKFEVVYVPYYFFMVLGVVYPAWFLLRRRRATV